MGAKRAATCAHPNRRVLSDRRLEIALLAAARSQRGWNQNYLFAGAMVDP
jgi:hypothetical protein